MLEIQFYERQVQPRAAAIEQHLNNYLIPSRSQVTAADCHVT